jgi:hypothetical protein
MLNRVYHNMCQHVSPTPRVSHRVRVAPQAGGIRTTDTSTDEQWDAANVWAPVMHMVSRDDHMSVHTLPPREGSCPWAISPVCIDD